MSISIISTTVVNSVVPGVGSYATGITITNTGGINATGYAISPGAVNNTIAIYNYGFLLGSSDGIFHTGSATIENHANIVGKAGPGIGINGAGIINNIGKSAYIYGAVAVEQLSVAGTISNQGSIVGRTVGIELLAGGFVTNSSGALIMAEINEGILVPNGNSTILNSGTINAPSSNGLDLQAGGYVLNSGLASSIFGGKIGIEMISAGSTVANDGTIIGTTNAGFKGINGGLLINGAGALLSGGYNGFYNVLPSTLINYGTVQGTDLDGSVSIAGALIKEGGLIINSGKGAIISSDYFGVDVPIGIATVINDGIVKGGADFGIYLGYGGTITNSGTIGGSGAVYFGSLFASDLIIDPGAVFDGGVTAAGHLSHRLEFASATQTGVGVLDLGGSFSGFNTIAFDAGASWSLEGSIAAFDSAAITGFTIGDTIVLDNFVVNPLDTTYVSGTGLELTDTAGNHITLGISGNFLTGNFAVIDPPNTTTITVQEIPVLISIISTTVVSTVDPGVGTYASGITITNTGLVSTSSYGFLGAASVSNIAITNFGTVLSTGQTGIELNAAAVVDNATSTALISAAAGYGIDFYKGFGTVTNLGSITGRGGVFLQAGGIVTNAAGAIIASTLVEAVDGQKAGLTVVNAGTITAGAAGIGVVWNAGGYVANNGTASLIRGGKSGIEGYGAVAGTVVNQGTVIGTLNSGIYLAAGGRVTNSAQALIAGNYAGIYIGSAGSTITNDGTVTAFGTPGVTPVSGIDLQRSGLVVNAGSAAVIASRYYGVNVRNGYGTVINQGTIIGKADYGVDLALGGTLTNAGTIGGGKGAVKMGVFKPDLLIIDQGAVFEGAVTASSGSSSTLEFAATTGASVGSLDLGGSFNGFNTIALDAGAKWSLEGSIAAFDSQLITGFSYGDTIILDHFVVNTLDTTYVSGTGLELTDTAGNKIILDIAGNFSTASFIVIDPPGTTTIEAVCYLRGTRIATPGGERAIETLRPGDSVITKFGGYRQIKWIGRQSYDRRFIAHNDEQIPVRICQGALGGALPRRDLFVSPGHSMLIDGVLVLAKALVNGLTVRQDECPDQVDYFQLEFETHDCVLAEGAWSESYADTPDWRDKFHNAAEFYRLFPDHVAPAEQKLCAARPLAGPALAGALRPVVMQAGFAARPGRLGGFVDHAAGGLVRGWAQDQAHPLLPVQLEIWADGKMAGHVLACDERADLLEAGIGRGRCGFAFTLPAGCDAREITVRRASDGALLPLVEQLAMRVA